jgi:membrane protein implicated in regulation of membrane protease activity
MRHRTLAIADPRRNASAHLVPFGVILLIPVFAALTLVILTLLLGIFVLWLCAVAGLFLSIFLADVVERWTQRLSRPPMGVLARRPVRIPGR